MIVVLDGGKHSSEHFRFNVRPNRIKIQTKEGGMYGRDKISIYQFSGKYENGCAVFTYVRSLARKQRNLVQSEYD